MCEERPATDGLTRFGLAEFNDMAASRRVAKIVVEACNALDFGARKIQRLSTERQCGGWYVADPMLDLVQERQQPILARGHGGKNITNDREFGFVSCHRSLHG